jgi:hypothetical protein
MGGCRVNDECAVDQVVDFTITTEAAGDYTVSIDGVDVTFSADITVDNPATIAAGLAAAINGDATLSAIVTATVQGDDCTVNAVVAGVGFAYSSTAPTGGLITETLVRDNVALYCDEFSGNCEPRVACSVDSECSVAGEICETSFCRQPSLSRNYIGNAIGYLTGQDLDAETWERSPVLVMSDAAKTTALASIAELSAGANHTCARDQVGGVWCWGAMTLRPSVRTCSEFSNLSKVFTFDKDATQCAVYPPLGTTDSERYPLVEYRINVTTGEITISRVYVDRIQPWPRDVYQGGIAASDPALEIASGFDHVCVRTDEQTGSTTNVWCLGYNGYGQLGDGTNNPWQHPAEIFLDQDGNVVRAAQISAGEEHSCALVDNKNAHCWGSNADGQIGNSALLRDESYRPFPVLLTPNP